MMHCQPCVNVLHKQVSVPETSACLEVHIVSAESAITNSCAMSRDTGGLQNLIDVLKALQKGSTGSTAAGKDLRIILLTVLLALAVDEPNRAACLAQGLVPLLVQMLQSIRDDEVRLLACFYIWNFL